MKSEWFGSISLFQVEIFNIGNIFVDFLFSDNATCSKIRCRDRETCLKDTNNSPRCVTCTHRCKSRHMSGPICGSNNSTYHSWCHMVQDACTKGYIIETKHSGKCVSMPEIKVLLDRSSVRRKGVFQAKISTTFATNSAQKMFNKFFM